ncbi:uncharacterized protein LOC131689597 [Topomyia yanbarensis]|uniref:uncharacterized protein LOC131689597 n=1 Tax=Topomyia yanbarensis TaxID=2498891 RepID=UPI00273BA970|nr:uncharacterized protein LOC131689597 [Topomyia yanbarensis]
MLKELRAACDKRKLILTVTVPSHPSVIGKNYPVKDLENTANYVILCTTEFRKLKKTSLVAPLYSLKEGSSNSVDHHINAWKRAGLSGDKIVMVIQTNALTYKLHQPNEYRLGSPVAKMKIRPFYKICQKLYSGSLEVFEETGRCPYAFREQNWYSYENNKSIQGKVAYAVRHSLGGIGVFNYDEDDPFDWCGDGSHPVTRTVLASLHAAHRPMSDSTASIAQRSVADSDFDAFEGYAQLRVVDKDSQDDTDIQINNEDLSGYSKPQSSYVVRQIPPRLASTCTSRPACRTTITTTTTTRRPVPIPGCGSGDDDSSDVSPCSDEDEYDSSVILANSDQAFAALNSPVEGPNANHLFSEVAGPASSGPLFSEREPVVRIKPVPKSAQFDPQRSRIGIIATASHGSAAPVQPSGPLTNIVATATYQTTAAPNTLLAGANSMSQLLSLLSNQITQPVSTVCPYDGIIPDPRNPRYYYLCRKGLPMCDENRFSCADGYVFNPVSQKCAPLM